MTHRSAFTSNVFTCSSRGMRRSVQLTSIHHDRTDCVFSLTLLLDPDDEQGGIGLSEKHDYLPTKNDAGRE